MKHQSKTEEQQLLQSLKLSDMQDPAVRDRLFRQFEPLVVKIVKQWQGRVPLCWDDIYGYAQEGFVYALNTWRPNKGQNFKQYVAWMMSHKIQDGANNEGHIVRFSAYMQKKEKGLGGTTFIAKSIDSLLSSYDNNGSGVDRVTFLGTDEQPEDVDLYYYLTIIEDKIRRNFTKRDSDIFMNLYGLKTGKPMMGKEVAKKYHVSVASISLIKKKIENFIRTLPELEELRNFL